MDQNSPKAVVVVREFRKGSADDIQSQDLVKDYILSFAFSAFIQCLFREITIQLIVLAWAILFIFFGVPLVFCVSAIPGVILLIYIINYGVHYNKGLEMAMAYYKITFVAEIIEPRIQMNTKECEFEVLLDKGEAVEFDPQLVAGRRKVVGTISVKSHESLSNSGWITRFAVDRNYPFHQIAEGLVNKVIQYGVREHWENIEGTTTECQDDVREVYAKVGFNIRQVYHKQIVGSSLRVMKSQLGIDINQYLNTRDKTLKNIPNGY